MDQSTRLFVACLAGCLQTYVRAYPHEQSLPEFLRFLDEMIAKAQENVAPQQKSDLHEIRELLREELGDRGWTLLDPLGGPPN